MAKDGKRRRAGGDAVGRDSELGAGLGGRLARKVKVSTVSGAAIVTSVADGRFAHDTAGLWAVVVVYVVGCVCEVAGSVEWRRRR
jgi:hypothetical protein